MARAKGRDGIAFRTCNGPGDPKPTSVLARLDGVCELRCRRQRFQHVPRVALLDRPHTCRILLSWTGEPASAPIRTFATVRPA